MYVKNAADAMTAATEHAVIAICAIYVPRNRDFTAPTAETASKNTESVWDADCATNVQTGATPVKCTLPAQQRTDFTAPTVLHAVKKSHSVRNAAYARTAAASGARTVKYI